MTHLIKAPYRFAANSAMPALLYCFLAIALLLTADEAGAQQHEAILASFVAEALQRNPEVEAAAARVEAAAAAVRPAGSLGDPMLGVGIVNFPVSEPGFGDFMTMKMLSLAQVLPYPGRRGLRRSIAQAELESARADLDASREKVREETRTAFYEIAFLGRALEVVGRHREQLTTFIEIAEVRYSAGVGDQAQVLGARTEVSRLEDYAASLAESRRSAVAQLNTARDLFTEAPVQKVQVPPSVARAAVGDDASQIQFTSSALGLRSGSSPLPPLEETQQRAVRLSPSLRAHEAMIRAQRLRLELARGEHLPDLDVSVQYGQRSGFPDMLSAMVSVALPIRKRQRQDLVATGAEAELRSLEAEHHLERNRILLAVAEAYADLERDRTHLALLVKTIIPQTRASLESAAISYQSGSGEFATLLQLQAELFDYENQYHRSLSDFAIRLAQLEQIVGEEVLR